MSDAVGKKLGDLRVCDLKEELEKRSLETNGVKNTLVERLQTALKDEGHNPDEYLFTYNEKKVEPKRRKSSKTEEINNTNDGDMTVDEIGTIDKEAFEENEKNQSNANDNEESLSLTIEEEEQNLLHNEAQDDKEKGKPGEAEAESSSNKKTADSGDNNKNETKADNSGIGDIKKDNEMKKDADSEQKTPSKSVAGKDEKEKSTPGTKSKASSSSRNLWVSGLSTLTRASDLKTIFSKYGKVIGAKVVTNTRTPGTRCYGYVTMASSSDASRCIDHLHRTELHGRIISVERTKSELGSSNHATSTIKKDDSSSKSKDSKKSIEKDEDKKKDPNSIKENKVTKEPKIEKIGDDKDGTDKNSNVKDKARSLSSRRDRKSRSSREKNHAERPKKTSEKEKDKSREVLSFQKIREERERQRLRERERELREEERRRREFRRRQLDEEDRLARERRKLQIERERLEREKAELLRMERERQKLERERIELERLELKRQQMKIMQSSRIDDSKRSLKRSADDRYGDSERKRSVSDRRFEAPPPPRFDSSLASYERSSEKKRDDYTNSKRDDYKRDIEPRHSSSYHSARDTHKETRYADADIRSSFRRDDRDVSGGTNSGQWHNSGPAAIKTFASNSAVVGSNWQTKADNHWRSIEPNQDRYDRTYNERSGYMDPSRGSMFIGHPTDRYGGQLAASRYENGKY